VSGSDLERHRVAALPFSPQPNGGGSSQVGLGGSASYASTDTWPTPDFSSSGNPPPQALAKSADNGPESKVEVARTNAFLFDASYWTLLFKRIAVEPFGGPGFFLIKESEPNESRAWALESHAGPMAVVGIALELKISDPIWIRLQARHTMYFAGELTYKSVNRTEKFDVGTVTNTAVVIGLATRL
jgi:hypothetical protein